MAGRRGFCDTRGMKNPSSVQRPLRVQLAGSATGSNSTLVAWLGELDGVEITGGGRTTAETLALATVGHPDVILLDFHGLPVSTGYAVTLFKELSPPPAVFVLTHDASPPMRRRCLEARVDAVFDKTAELDALRAALGELSLRMAPTAPVAAVAT